MDVPPLVDFDPLRLSPGFWYTDFWQAYQAVIPDGQHVAGGKETGQTNHIERWNTTLRQRIGRVVRKTRPFSKSFVMHGICLHLFVHCYNLEIAIRRAGATTPLVYSICLICLDNRLANTA
ncbi:hypothetical protein HC891_14065 [Candidatus Gracilibacteria bacterium]|nr:hypothetical protein [Candidatus Gracilibacteria bacterium]